MEEGKSGIQKPQWLAVLEQESWQAELLISGVAIFGALQLPNQLERLIAFCLMNVQTADYPLFYSILILAYFTVFAVISGLIIHFVLRAFWIGLIGFNSVYPQGINVEHEGIYSKYFLTRTTERLPKDTNGLINNLDQWCSIFFVIMGLAIISSFSFGIVIAVIYLVKVVLSFVLPEHIFSWVYLVIIIVFYLSIFLFIFLNTKRMRKNEKAQRLYYQLYNGFQKIFIPFVNRITQYISLTMITNTTNRKVLLGFIIVPILTGLLAAFSISNSKLIYLAANLANRDGLVLSDFDRPDKIIPTHYEDMRANEESILSAIIPTYELTERTLRVFVPIFNNEGPLYRSCTQEYKSLKEKADSTFTKRVHRLDCYDRYHRFYIDEQAQTTTIKRMLHPSNKQFGIVTHLALDSLAKGEHLLKIEKIDLASTKVARRISVPFYLK